MKKRTTYKKVIPKKKCVNCLCNNAELQLNENQWICDSCAQHMNDLGNENN